MWIGLQNLDLKLIENLLVVLEKNLRSGQTEILRFNNIDEAWI